jgi:hypothetical protein
MTGCGYKLPSCTVLIHGILLQNSVLLEFSDVRYFYQRTFPVPPLADAGAGFAFIGLLLWFLAWISGCPWDWR